jgi:hypothetical protein
MCILTCNLNSLLKHLVLGQHWAKRRLKALRFHLLHLPGRVMRRSGQVFIRLARDHPSFGLLIAARRRILALARGPTC